MRRTIGSIALALILAGMAVVGIAAGLSHLGRPLLAFLETTSGFLAAVSALFVWRSSPWARSAVVLWLLVLMVLGAWSERDLLLRVLTPLSENWLSLGSLLALAILALVAASAWVRKLISRPA